MQDRYLFEYAVIRIVPQVEREEFLNAGVIMYCAKLKFLQAKFNLDDARLQIFAPKTDLDEVRQNLCAIEKICIGGADGGPIAKLDLPSRFRWLTATRSTVVQPSKVHPGFCVDAAETLERLYNQLVL
ncbi:DUF3037 domain-containing protein [Mucilaginibacter gynuensis]|uniref:DUF3037 domain-containing protein n=1 Tax=Mucilaginibacter gynuensis TaxID=1302236 RepID=A0ABP8FLX3_9SPHI